MVHPVLRVNAVNRVPDPRRRTGFVPPLSVRWAETVERIRTELPPSHPLQSGGNTMQNEIALDDLQDAFYAAKAALAPATPNPETRAAAQEYYDMRRAWNSACLEIKNAQGWLGRAVNDWKHRLLSDISTDCFHIPNQLPSAVGDGPQFNSILAARRATTELLPKLQWARGVLAKISEAKRFEAQERDQQALDLVAALWTRLQESNARIINLESANTALAAKLDRIERRRKKPKPQKAAA
jgi:hypothetical protein